MNNPGTFSKIFMNLFSGRTERIEKLCFYAYSAATVKDAKNVL